MAAEMEGAKRQAARQARVIQQMQAWLDNASGEILRHYNNDDGVAYTPYRVARAELSRLLAESEKEQTQ